MLRYGPLSMSVFTRNYGFGTYAGNPSCDWLRSKHRKEENELMTKQTKQMYETRLRQERELEETIARHRHRQRLQISEKQNRVYNILQQTCRVSNIFQPTWFTFEWNRMGLQYCTCIWIWEQAGFTIFWNRQGL